MRYEPAAEAAQVGGDWYDAFLQPDGATVLVIGDVIGHDTVAAAAMGQVRTLLRGIAATTGDGPADVLRRVDQVMQTLQVDTTATAVVARLEQTPEEREPRRDPAALVQRRPPAADRRCSPTAPSRSCPRPRPTCCSASTRTASAASPS